MQKVRFNVSIVIIVIELILELSEIWNFNNIVGYKSSRNFPSIMYLHCERVAHSSKICTRIPSYCKKKIRKI